MRLNRMGLIDGIKQFLKVCYQPFWNRRARPLVVPVGFRRLADGSALLESFSPPVIQEKRLRTD